MSVANLPPSPVVFGCAGAKLTADEELLFRDLKPVGYILFARNIDTPTQVKKLTERLREISDDSDVLIMIDQEGGRVQRLRPPHWPDYPPMSRFGSRAFKNIDEAATCVSLNYRLISSDLRDLSINVNCAPILDLPISGSHRVIGDRAFSDNPEISTKLAQAACNGLLDGGVLPVIKHIPGHGRAVADSHEELPYINASIYELRERDFIPFKALSRMPAAMTAHIVYTAIDPKAPCSSSFTLIHDTIRDEIGYDGLLFSDDVCMKAISGPVETRVASVLRAGCDIALHCDGNFRDMAAIAETCFPMGDNSFKRLTRAKRLLGDSDGFDPVSAKERISAFLASC